MCYSGVRHVGELIEYLDHNTNYSLLVTLRVLVAVTSASIIPETILVFYDGNITNFIYGTSSESDIGLLKSHLEDRGEVSWTQYTEYDLKVLFGGDIKYDHFVLLPAAKRTVSVITHSQI